MFLVGDLVKINQKMIQRPLSIYDFHEVTGYYASAFFEQGSTGIILDFKNEEKMSYVKILTSDNKIGWVRSVYLENINLSDV